MGSKNNSSLTTLSLLSGSAGRVGGFGSCWVRRVDNRAGAMGSWFAVNSWWVAGVLDQSLGGVLQVGRRLNIHSIFVIVFLLSHSAIPIFINIGTVLFGILSYSGMADPS
jgi:hypothetical protein